MVHKHCYCAGIFPVHGFAPSKTSQSTILITAINSPGEVLPAQFQVSTNVKTPDREKVRFETVSYLVIAGEPLFQ